MAKGNHRRRLFCGIGRQDGPGSLDKAEGEEPAARRERLLWIFSKLNLRSGRIWGRAFFKMRRRMIWG